MLQSKHEHSRFVEVNCMHEICKSLKGIHTKAKCARAVHFSALVMVLFALAHLLHDSRWCIFGELVWLMHPRFDSFANSKREILLESDVKALGV